ncbi:STK36 [Symbiodinium natans]|uniref:STK36 protein n=1 Tax=Symbiodinium natans TaxID=878477 RepID=A0A812NL38_9DINO|nr:STK36 [Symbiodinium natans]
MTGHQAHAVEYARDDADCPYDGRHAANDARDDANDARHDAWHDAYDAGHDGDAGHDAQRAAKVEEVKKDFLNLKFGDREPPIDQDVKAFMDKHKIDDKALLKRLNEEIMKKRDTKESVLLKLDELLEDMGDPKGYLEMKLEAFALLWDRLPFAQLSLIWP